MQEPEDFKNFIMTSNKETIEYVQKHVKEQLASIRNDSWNSLLYTRPTHNLSYRNDEAGTHSGRKVSVTKALLDIETSLIHWFAQIDHDKANQLAKTRDEGKRIDDLLKQLERMVDTTDQSFTKVKWTIDFRTKNAKDEVI